MRFGFVGIAALALLAAGSLAGCSESPLTIPPPVHDGTCLDKESCSDLPSFDQREGDSYTPGLFRGITPPKRKRPRTDDPFAPRGLTFDCGDEPADDSERVGP